MPRTRTMLPVMAMIALLGMVALPVPAQAADTEVQVEIPRPPRRGKAQKPSTATLGLPEGVKHVDGVVLAGRISLEKSILRGSAFRKACREMNLGILYAAPHFDAVFNWVGRDSARRLQNALAELARKTGHPEIEFAPLLTVGHSTGGIFCRNVAYWKPERVIGIIHVKSGNFQDGLYDMQRSLAGVPLMAINGEYERFGPKGGDLKLGLRSAYSLHPDNKTKKNQTQWVMIRMQMLNRRLKNPDNLMSLVVHRNAGHGGWDGDMDRLCAQFVRSACKARLPGKTPYQAEARCRKVTAEDGWLSDPDIKDPQHEPAPHAKYSGDKKLAFWHVDGEIARAVTKYHSGEWAYPDPTAGQSDEQRYTPPPILRDLIDRPAPPVLTWTGTGNWNGKSWSADDSDALGVLAAEAAAVLPASSTSRTLKLTDDGACANLTVSKGNTLDVGPHQLAVHGHADFQEGTRLVLEWTDADTKRRSGRVRVAGNVKLAGELVIRSAPPGGGEVTFRVISAGGRMSGTFAKLTLPDNWQGTVKDGVVTMQPLASPSK